MAVTERGRRGRSRATLLPVRRVRPVASFAGPTAFLAGSEAASAGGAPDVRRVHVARP